MKEAVQKNAPMRVLVIQMARLGDTLQSLMALRAAKQLYPELEIHFLCRENFSVGARRVPWIKEVVTFPTDTLLGEVLEGKKREAQALPDLARWITPIATTPWDMIVNWTFSEASSYLTAVLPARVKLGYSRTKRLEFSGTDGWSHYVQAVIQGRVPQNIHLTDILTTQLLTALQIHCGDPQNEGNAPVTSKGFFNLSLREGALDWLEKSSFRKWIGVQIGAAREHKTWPSSHWAAWIRTILERNPENDIVLLGGQQDLATEQEILRELGSFNRVRRGSIVSLVGKTDFDVWASVISRCQWVASADTAAIHLASLLGTRVLNLSVGPVRWSETGPYGNGHYVVAPTPGCAACLAESVATAEHSCRTQLTAEAAYAAWSYANAEWAHRRNMPIERHFAQLGWASETDKVQVFRSRIRPTQDGGGVHYEPLIQRPLDLDGWTADVVGHIARAWYCGWTPPVAQELKRGTIAPALVRAMRELGEASTVLAKVCAEARTTALKIKNRSSTLKSDHVMQIQDRNELRALAKTLIDLDQLVERTVQTAPALRVFHQMSKVLMHHLGGDRLEELGQETAYAYGLLSDGVQLMRDWSQRTLELARPMAVVPGAVVPLVRPPSSPNGGPQA